jgi:hypothetical protein
MSLTMVTISGTGNDPDGSGAKMTSEAVDHPIFGQSSASIPSRMHGQIARLH